MTTEYVLAIDVGTGSIRCLVTDLLGRQVALASQPWSYQTPEELALMGHEFQPEELWQTLCQIIRRALAEAGINPEHIRGISATSQREGAVFLDKKGRELYAGPNIDLRALFEGIAIDDEFGDEVYSLCGHKPSFMLIPAKLRWFRINQPEVYGQISSVLSISDWIAYRLTGELACELSSACELGLVDIKRRLWCDKLVERLNLPGSIYPRLGNAGSQVGAVSVQAAAETGLVAGTVVALGAADSQSGLLGLGVSQPGQVGVVAGWSAPVQLVTERPLSDAAGRVWTSCHALERLWILESNAGEAGNAYRWLKENLLGDESQEGYALMEQMAQSVPLGAEGTLALLGPDVMNMGRLGLRWGGFLFPLPLSFSQISRGHLVRAALENLCFAIKANYAQLEEISETGLGPVSLGGGLARSRVLPQMLADVLDRPVLLPKLTEVSALGAAMCAATGAGLYSSLTEAVLAMKGEQHCFEPDVGNAAEYAEYYQKWRVAARRLEELSQELQ
jgi:sugar (pentulose or hexulose) kinase